MAELTDPGGHAVSVDVREENSTPVIRLSGELDMTCVEQIRPAIQAALASETERVIFDVTSLTFIDSSGITLLVTATRHVSNVEIRNPRSSVRRIIELTGLHRIMQVTP